jgi:fumarylacetoacetase
MEQMKAKTSLARDIQALEMPPLGPLNGKSFATSISPWIITLDALTPFEAPAPPREATSGAASIASYLKDPKATPTYTIHLQAELVANNIPTTICKSELGSMYWSFRNLVAHQTSNGCCINTGDVLGTGTISGSEGEAHGCLLELTKGGEVTFAVEGGAGASKRMYLENDDMVRISGWASEGVGFGECVGVVLPAN